MGLAILDPQQVVTTNGQSWMIPVPGGSLRALGPDLSRASRTQSGSGVEDHMKTVFTTGEAAKVCKVSQQTIIRCFDNGQLKGFRVPGSRFRRIPREALYKFMKDNGIPTEALESGKRKVLLVDDDVELVELISKVLEEDGRFEVRIANNGFDAGMMVKEYRPDLIILDVMLPDINGKEVCQRVRADNTLEDVRILCISGMIEEDKIQELKLAGADDFLHKPFDIEELIDRMCGQLELEPLSAST
jgi:excisionase family DNA binding protein